MLNNVFAVLATGPSMSQEIADFVRGRCRVIAVCDAYRLAPWADALVCADRRWWNLRPDALELPCPKFAAVQIPGTTWLQSDLEFAPGCNSGLLGMRVARAMGALQILLCGFDMYGTHYFGPHEKPLRNTTPDRFRVHLRQFKSWRGGCEVFNCTSGSALTQFPFTTLGIALSEHAA